MPLLPDNSDSRAAEVTLTGSVPGLLNPSPTPAGLCKRVPPSATDCPCTRFRKRGMPSPPSIAVQVLAMSFGAERICVGATRRMTMRLGISGPCFTNILSASNAVRMILYRCLSELSPHLQQDPLEVGCNCAADRTFQQKYQPDLPKLRKGPRGKSCQEGATTWDSARRGRPQNVDAIDVAVRQSILATTF